MVTLAVGADGATGAGPIVTSADSGEVQPAASVTVKLYLPVVKPGIVALAVDPVIAPGLMVQLPAGRPLKTTLPVVVEQVGCVIVPIIGAEGIAGAGLTVNKVGAETHVGSVALRAVTA